MKISIVIPCYNSEKTIGQVVDELVETIKEKLDYEIILVNDGSTIELWNIIKDIAKKYEPNVTGIKFAKNFGQHAALLAGYREAKGDVMIQMDDDGQCDPSAIFTLLEKIDEGYDIVFGKYKKAEKGLFRKLGSEINRRMCISLIDMPSNLHPTSISAAKRYVVDEMIKYDKPYPYIGGLFFRTTSNICDVEVPHRKRAFGKSNYTLRKLIKLWVNGFTAFSVKPLRFASTAGVLSAFVGLIFAIIIVVRKILGVGVLAGWSSMMSLMLILCGLVMLMLGIIGEYIGRVYICLNNSPQYVVSDVFRYEEQ